MHVEDGTRNNVNNFIKCLIHSMILKKKNVDKITLIVDIMVVVDMVVDTTKKKLKKLIHITPLITKWLNNKWNFLKCHQWKKTNKLNMNKIIHKEDVIIEDSIIDTIKCVQFLLLH